MNQLKFVSQNLHTIHTYGIPTTCKDKIKMYLLNSYARYLFVHNILNSLIIKIIIYLNKSKF